MNGVECHHPIPHHQDHQHRLLRYVNTQPQHNCSDGTAHVDVQVYCMYDDGYVCIRVCMFMYIGFLMC